MAVISLPDAVVRKWAVMVHVGDVHSAIAAEVGDLRLPLHATTGYGGFVVPARFHIRRVGLGGWGFPGVHKYGIVVVYDAV